MDLFCEIESFYKKFNGKKGFIGKTVNGKNIPFFVVEKSCFPKVICQYSIHAREFITSFLALSQIKYFVRNGKVGTVYFIPAVNLDGIEICLNGNPLYKANARGVDLNVNFDAKWGMGEHNKMVKGDKDYIGESPFSEPETKALRDFTLCVKPDITLSYHSKGEEIYYEFGQDEIDKCRDYIYAKVVAKETGYLIKSTPNSAGGYKDWCIEKLNIPALTIEVGSDLLSHPIKECNLPEIYKKNKRVINVITETFYDRKIHELGDQTSAKSPKT